MHQMNQEKYQKISCYQRRLQAFDKIDNGFISTTQTNETIISKY